MRVQVINDVGDVIWGYGVDAVGNSSAITCRGYREDGTIGEVLMALGAAVGQAGAEALPPDYVYGMAYGGASSSEVNRNVPVA